jgi:RNA polymerase sigma-70 factor, ECF subfamily
MSRSDEELMDAVAHGDSRALGDLIERYHAPLRRFFAQLLAWDRTAADDLVQETFVRLLRQRTYSPKRAFRPWLYAVAHNLAKDYWLRQSREPAALGSKFDEAAASLEETSPGPEERVEAKDELSRIRQALSRLPEEYRLTLVLRFGQDLQLAEIASVLGIPLGTVKSRLSVGARKLRVALRDIDQEANNDQ